MAVFEGLKFLNDTIINDTMSDDEIVASEVPPRDLFLQHFDRVCPSVRLSVHYFGRSDANVRDSHRQDASDVKKLSRYAFPLLRFWYFIFPPLLPAFLVLCHVS